MQRDTGATGASRAPRFGLMLGLVALLAFAVREHYVLSAIVDNPVRGDIREYVAYAWNLVQHGVYGSTVPPATPVSDDYRMPGYPWLIAIGMRAWPQPWGVLDGWYPFVLQMQVVLGTATVVGVALLARHWLSATWSIAAALMLALWPHHVAATKTLLSEVVFGFCLVAALYCFARAWHSRRVAWWAGAGAAFCYGCLVNPLLFFFPLCLAVLAFRHAQRRGAGLMLCVFLLPILAVGLRNAGIEGSGRGTDRASLNFVQGSWPDYHLAANRFRAGDPIAVAIAREIDAEHAELRHDARAGLARIGRRMGEHPAFYARWYASKPWLLWSWQIRIGASDIGYDVVRRSPFERPGVLRALRVAYEAINPLLTAMTLASALVLMFLGVRRASLLPAAATGALVVYVTLVHTVLQAEPRYATAYRGLEAILVMTTLACAVGFARNRWPASSAGHEQA